jgi:hypothetical protein
MCDEYAQKKKDCDENFVLLKTTEKNMYRLEIMASSEDESNKTHSKMFAGKHVSQLNEAKFSAMLWNDVLFNALRWNSVTTSIQELLASSLKDAKSFLNDLKVKKAVDEDNDNDDDSDDGDYNDSGASGNDDDDERDGEEEEEVSIGNFSRSHFILTRKI